MNALMTSSEAAAYCGVSRGVIWHAVSVGLLSHPLRASDRLRYFDAQEIRAFREYRQRLADLRALTEEGV
jgi:hypothetical protein